MGTTKETTAQVASLSRSCHPACIACGRPEHGGLGLRFREASDASVVATFACESRYQGYPNQLHGGIIATLLDAAMMHCLFARGICGVTVNIEVQFRHPVRVDTQADVRAWLCEESPSYYVLRAEIVQDGTTRAVAEGVFAESASVKGRGGESR